MILQYCSDLHLEFPENRLWLARNPLEPIGDLLVLAGDTYYFGQGFKQLPLWETISSQFDEVYVLPGNHEYYGGYDLVNYEGAVKEELFPNVWLVNNVVIEKPDSRLIFTTLWSKIERQIAPILLGLNDFKRIRYNGKVITIEQYNQLHRTSREFLTDALESNSKKKQVVITHHLPSEHCNVEEFKGSSLNEAFCVDMTSFIETSGVDAWIYGHSHRNKPEFSIGKTRMLTNQLGYVQYGEHSAFQWNAWVDI
ncbi:MAG: metallophosphoesterase [Bacteroidota bacterium]